MSELIKATLHLLLEAKDAEIARLKGEVESCNKAHDFERRQRKHEEDLKLEAFAENCRLRTEPIRLGFVYDLQNGITDIIPVDRDGEPIDREVEAKGLLSMISGYWQSLAAAKAEVERATVEANYWRESEINNPCGHSGMESRSCEKCGYPDPVKTIDFLHNNLAAVHKALDNKEQECISIFEHHEVQTKELQDALDGARGKVKAVVAYAEDVLIGSDHDYAGNRIIEILTEEDKSKRKEG